MQESLCTLCVLSGFDGRAGSEMSKGHIFPQGMLAAITLIGGGAGDGGARARARCDLGLLFSVAVTALLGAGSDPKVLKLRP